MPRVATEVFDALLELFGRNRAIDQIHGMSPTSGGDRPLQYRRCQPQSKLEEAE